MRSELSNTSIMRAMVLSKPGTPLVWTELPDRQPGPGQIRLQVAACGVHCTDLRAGRFHGAAVLMA